MSCLCFRGDVEQLLSHVCDDNQDVESVAVTRYPRREGKNSWGWGLLYGSCLNRLISSCPNVWSLKLNDIHIWCGGFYDNLGILLPKVNRLHLSHSCTLTPKHIKNIATKCCNLAQLGLSGEECYNDDGWEDAYCTLFQQRWRTLTHFQFDASKLRDEAFKVLKYMCVHM